MRVVVARPAPIALPQSLVAVVLARNGRYKVELSFPLDVEHRNLLQTPGPIFRRAVPGRVGCRDASTAFVWDAAAGDEHESRTLGH